MPTADSTTPGGGSRFRPPAQPILVDTRAAAVAVNVAASTIRSWAHRGRINAAGRDPRGRTTYDLQEVMDAAQRHRN